jgi:hypothetical protein
MTRQTATGHASTTATPASVWALLEDVTTWTTWAPFETAVLELPGEKEPHGVGAIRRFQRGRFTTREQVTEFVPDRRLSYRLLSGLPLRDYEADIDLRRQQDRTHITWSASFAARIPGTGRVFRRGMQKLYTDYAQRLAGAAVESSARSRALT